MRKSFVALSVLLLCSAVLFADGRTDEALANLSQLIDERLLLMADVAKSKWNTHSAIEDPAREQVVLDNVGKLAAAKGLPPLWVQHFFREQIEAGKLIQYQLFSEWKTDHHERFRDAPNLVTDVRPRLDELSGKLLDTLQRTWPMLHDHPIHLDKSSNSPLRKHHSQAVSWAITPLSDGSAQSQ